MHNISKFRMQIAPFRPASTRTALLIVCLLLLSAVLAVRNASAQQTPQLTHFKFKWTGNGRSLKKGAVSVSFAHYTSEDGTLVERLIESYKSNEEARQELESLVGSAARVVKRGPKINAEGKQIGDRVELDMNQRTDISYRAVIAWTDGPRVFVIRSLSFPYALDFEQQDYPLTGTKSASGKETSR